MVGAVALGGARRGVPQLPGAVLEHRGAYGAGAVVPAVGEQGERVGGVGEPEQDVLPWQFGGRGDAGRLGRGGGEEGGGRAGRIRGLRPLRLLGGAGQEGGGEQGDREEC